MQHKLVNIVAGTAGLEKTDSSAAPNSNSIQQNGKTSALTAARLYYYSIVVVVLVTAAAGNTAGRLNQSAKTAAVEISSQRRCK